MVDMSMPVPERDEQPAPEAALREHADGLRELAARHGILELRIAGPGRLVGRLAEDRDLFDVADFETEASTLLGAEVELFSDRVLGNANVSPDLPTATPL
jgi:hypothetical protein